MAQRLVPKNWASFQHYKDRNPPWIKLHKGLLDDRAYTRLPLASKALAPLLWLLASESKDGAFDADVDELSFRLRLTEKEVNLGLDPLIKAGFFMPLQSDSNSLAGCEQVAPESCSEREGETEAEREGETRARASTPSLEGVPESLMDDYMKIRKAKKAGPLTATAIAGLQREASKAGLSLEQAVTACVEFSWQGFNAGWYAERTQGKTQQTVTTSSDPDSRSAIEAEGVAKGIGPWNEINEQWHLYKARVRGKQANGLGLESLAAMAAQRSQAGAH
jgi:hypothetical protein